MEYSNIRVIRRKKEISLQRFDVPQAITRLVGYKSSDERTLFLRSYIKLKGLVRLETLRITISLNSFFKSSFSIKMMLLCIKESCQQILQRRRAGGAGMVGT